MLAAQRESNITFRVVSLVEDVDAGRPTATATRLL